MKRFLAIIVATYIFMFGAQAAGLLGTVSNVSAQESAEKKIKSLIISSQKVSMVKDTVEQFDLNAVYTDKTTELVTDKAEWTSSKPGVATVENGKIVAIAPGTATIKAKYQKKFTTMSVKVTETKEISKLEILDSKSIELEHYKNKQVELKVFYKDGTTEIVTDKATWTPSSTKIVTVEAGLISALKPGNASVSASFGGKTVKMYVKVQLSKEPSKLVLRQKSIEVPVGKSEYVYVEAIFNDKRVSGVSAVAEWTPEDKTLFTVFEGTVTGVKEGSTNVTISYGGKSTTLTVRVINLVDEDVAKVLAKINAIHVQDWQDWQDSSELMNAVQLMREALNSPALYLDFPHDFEQLTDDIKNSVYRKMIATVEQGPFQSREDVQKRLDGIIDSEIAFDIIRKEMVKYNDDATITSEVVAGEDITDRIVQLKDGMLPNKEVSFRVSWVEVPESEQEYIRITKDWRAILLKTNDTGETVRAFVKVVFETGNVKKGPRGAMFHEMIVNIEPVKH
ncbi:Ig-like domain-containing protein [Brevibacillus porteri]|uniref:Ig-like domain-containing protein n=1 Tax=Brevibacillus porteri TaxID=2126350 RepID=UPI0036345689